jgi:DNA-binding IclR family transcriptional regulator
MMERWTFLTNHGHVLVCIARDPEIRLRDVAAQVGITERAAQRIVADLVEAGYLTSSKIGRRNRYEIQPDLPFRHPLESTRTVRSLLDVLAAEVKSQAVSAGRRPRHRSNGQAAISAS